jgi:uncharacterized protein
MHPLQRDSCGKLLIDFSYQKSVILFALALLISLSPRQPTISRPVSRLQPRRSGICQKSVRFERIFLGEADEYMHRPLYRAIVLRARELHLAGATVLRGPMGYGRSTHLHNAHILRLSLDLPIVVEIVDETQKITAFLPELEKIMRGGLITMERAQVFRYRH